MIKTITIKKSEVAKLHLTLEADKEYDLKIILREDAQLFLFLAIRSTELQKYSCRLRVVHISPTSKSFVQMNAVLYDESEVKLYGKIEVQKKTFDVDAVLKQKVILMSEKAKIILDPVLEIDDNRLTGSHAAVISSPDPSHVYYLTSRGLPDTQAKEILVQGLLNIPEGYSTMEA